MAYPASTAVQHALANTHTSIGILLKETDTPEDAQPSLTAAAAIMGALVDSNPSSIQFKIGLANANLEIADLLRLIRHSAEARSSYEKAIAIIERVIEAQPAFAPHFQIFLVFGLKGVGATQQAAGQAAEAVASWRRAIASDEHIQTTSDETLYLLAGCHARLGGIAGAPGSNLSSAEGAAELDTAMAVLRRAADAGYRNHVWMRRDPDLDPLRSRPDFERLMLDLAFPVEPFATD